ncbi:hypothetical protein [Halostella sp. PRR32]|nr:hypothetical protein [Halostella sp. PRR32]
MPCKTDCHTTFSFRRLSGETAAQSAENEPIGDSSGGEPDPEYASEAHR